MPFLKKFRTEADDTYQTKVIRVVVLVITAATASTYSTTVCATKQDLNDQDKHENCEGKCRT